MSDFSRLESQRSETRREHANPNGFSGIVRIGLDQVNRSVNLATKHKTRIAQTSIDKHYNLVHKVEGQEIQETANQAAIKEHEKRRQSARYFYTSHHTSRRNSGGKRMSELSCKSQSTWNQSINNDIDEFGKPMLSKTLKFHKPKTPSLVSEMRHTSGNHSFRESRCSSRLATTKGNLRKNSIGRKAEPAKKGFHLPLNKILRDDKPSVVIEKYRLPQSHRQQSRVQDQSQTMEKVGLGPSRPKTNMNSQRQYIPLKQSAQSALSKRQAESIHRVINANISNQRVETETDFPEPDTNKAQSARPMPSTSTQVKVKRLSKRVKAINTVNQTSKPQ